MGQVVATPAAMEVLQRTSLSATLLLARHVAGDWGDCDPQDARANDDAIVRGERILSMYRVGERDVIWVSTESSRCVTTLLTPDDY